ncbi:MAG: (Fe-S)-binding protein, partial [Cyclobacteriaceae bacterium]|nr:(Fe-S)-binding protein [Cyclobacteriaceae bacterium]
AEQHWLRIFKDCDVVVGPTGSCVYHISQHFKQKPDLPVYEISAFFLEYMNLPLRSGIFEGNIAILQSCHTLRGLKNGNSSELGGNDLSTVEKIIHQISSLNPVFPERRDECCGFGGMFSVKEEAVSVAMGRQRIEEFIQCKTDIITGTDMSCLMHIDGIIKREKLKMKVIHIAEIMNESIQ